MAKDHPDPTCLLDRSLWPRQACWAKVPGVDKFGGAEQMWYPTGLTIVSPGKVITVAAAPPPGALPSTREIHRAAQDAAASERAAHHIAFAVVDGFEMPDPSIGTLSPTFPGRGSTFLGRWHSCANVAPCRWRSPNVSELAASARPHFKKPGKHALFAIICSGWRT
jgi:hypothetical protein